MDVNALENHFSHFEEFYFKSSEKWLVDCVSADPVDNGLGKKEECGNLGRRKLGVFQGLDKKF
ncbi:hypothetical protein BpHYR1_042936 [Brachionus plicatilis]|uniref:Uncharacterized protein n=1 Tax=Brachionus plicatilis TaxID=10195 RepID=A0A3M7SW68_BRAPC|nr:hypothetical protein BpHYR1_042936 [Brachionus plicatilis]